MTHPRSNPRRRAPRAPRPSAPYHPSADPWAVQRALIAEHQMHAAAARQQAYYDPEAREVAEYHDAEAERLEAELDAVGRGVIGRRRRNPRDARDAHDPGDWVTIEECACHSCTPMRLNPPKRKATGAYADLDSIVPVIAEALAKHGLTMDGFEGGVEGVKFTRGGKSRAGACSYSPSLRKCKIMFNGLAWPAFTEEQRLNTILHEAAHAIEFLTTGRSGHGPRWQSIARSIGCTGDKCMTLEASQAMVDAYAEAKGLEKRKIITPELAREASVDFAVGDYVSFEHKRQRLYGKITGKDATHARVIVQEPATSVGITGKIPYPLLQKEAPPRFAEKVAGVDKPAPGESLSAWQARTGRGVRANPLPRSGEELSWTLGPSGLQERDVEDTYITIRRRKATEANEALKDLGFIDEDFFESRGSFLFIEEMAVSSKDRRQGIGRKLVEEALRGAKSPVWVIAAPLGSSEHPEGFYKRLGFEPVLQNRHGQTLMVRR